MRRWVLVIGLGLGAVGCRKHTAPEVLSCLDARLRASDAWRAFERAADTGASAQEAAVSAADAELHTAEAAMNTDVERARLTYDVSPSTQARIEQHRRYVASLQTTATSQHHAAERARSRATQAGTMIARFGNPYAEIVGARAWGSDPNDSGAAELRSAGIASEAAWTACRLACVDLQCSGVTHGAGLLPSTTE